MSFKHIGKDSSDAGALSDHVVQLRHKHIGFESKLDELSAAVTELQDTARNVTVANVDPPASPTPPINNHEKLYDAVADIQNTLPGVIEKLDAIRIPELAPIFEKLSGLETRLRFNEKAALDRGKETLAAAIAVLETRINGQNSLIAQADMFRAKTLQDHNHKITLLWRAVGALTAIVIVAGVLHVLGV